VGSRAAPCGRRRHPDAERALYLRRNVHADTNSDADSNRDSVTYPNINANPDPYSYTPTGT